MQACSEDSALSGLVLPPLETKPAWRRFIDAQRREISPPREGRRFGGQPGPPEQGLEPVKPQVDWLGRRLAAACLHGPGQ